MSSISTWCILRCSGRSTLGLAESLGRAGFEAWTPVEMKRNRRPRKQTADAYPVPIMPTFVFSRSDRLLDLLELSETPNKGHDDFSVFHYLDRIPIIADSQLAPLRREEAALEARYRRHLTKSSRAEPFNRGQSIRMPDGSFAGMSGQVVESDGKFTLVCFGRMAVKISTFILRQDVANRFQAATYSKAA